MTFRLIYPVLLLALLGLAYRAVGTSDGPKDRMFHNEWAVEIHGGERLARDVAHDYGFTFIGQIGTLDNTYSLVRDTHHRRSRRAAEDITSLLHDDDRVSWVAQQETIFHEKRDAIAVPHDQTGDDYVPPFNDPEFPRQWYLHNNGQNNATPGVDMNLAPVWKLGIMGKGSVVCIVDDGIDGTHPDLKANYDPVASWDFNDNDPNPHPDDRKSQGGRNNHGTRCAGEVAAVANNSICGVGAAPQAGIGGIRFLDGDVTDSMEASALTYASQHIDIYSCCWGPSDDGKTMRHPGPLMTAALEMGTKKGRGGKGSIYVWASGNGGHNGDDCGADGYVGNINTISVGSINDQGQSVYFMEKCPSTMAVVLSGGMSDRSLHTYSQRQLNLVITTDLHDQCIDNFIGTSSAAPLAAGLLALVLQANPNLTWRDIQHIVVNSAHIPNTVESGWHVNGAGFHVNEKFGFGVFDGGKMVELALTWNNVAEQKTCEVPTLLVNREVLQGTVQTVMFVVDCPQVAKLEHTLAAVSFKSPRRGDISLTLWSPSGTPSELLSQRRNDNSTDDVVAFPFMSVRNWGERASGQWLLDIMYHFTPVDVAFSPKWPDIPRQHDQKAKLMEVKLTLYGTSDVGDKGTSGTGEVNPAVNPDLKGHLKDDEVIDVFNTEQNDDEEIVVDANDLAQGVKPPPNAAHNLNKDGDGIDTGQFDKILEDPHIRSLIHKIYLFKEKEKKREFEVKEHHMEVRGPAGGPRNPSDEGVQEERGANTEFARMASLKRSHQPLEEANLEIQRSRLYYELLQDVEFRSLIQKLYLERKTEALNKLAEKERQRGRRAPKG